MRYLHVPMQEDILKSLDQLSKNTGVKKKKIVEKALLSYINEEIKTLSLIDTFKK